MAASAAMTSDHAGPYYPAPLASTAGQVRPGSDKDLTIRPQRLSPGW
jgi:hypothetical protein